MIVAVASGKGGTGKTSVAVNMALSIGNVQFLDCDVEEPNAHLLLHPEISRTEPVYLPVPVINEELCDHCGKCAEFCSNNAIFVSPEKVLVFPELCYSCAAALLFVLEKLSVKNSVGLELQSWVQPEIWNLSMVSLK